MLNLRHKAFGLTIRAITAGNSTNSKFSNNIKREVSIIKAKNPLEPQIAFQGDAVSTWSK